MSAQSSSPSFRESALSDRYRWCEAAAGVDPPSARYTVLRIDGKRLSSALSFFVALHELLLTSQWTPEEQVRIQEIARATIPGIKTHAAPPGLQAQAGVEGVVKHLSERIDEIMQGK